MDKELLKEREKFKKSFMSVHTDAPKPSKRPSEIPESTSSKKAKPEKKVSAKEKLDLAKAKQMGGSSNFKFGVLTKIVRHMKSRHLEGKIFDFNVIYSVDSLNMVMSRLCEKQSGRSGEPRHLRLW